MTVVSSIGLVYYSGGWASRTGAGEDYTEKLITFNGVNVNWEELSPVKMTRITSAPLTTAPVWLKVCAITGLSGIPSGDDNFTLQGRKMQHSAGVSTGVRITRMRR